MRFRKLRMVFSATCLVAYALLVALWVRSYFSDDFLVAFIPKHRVVDIGSECGVHTYDNHLRSETRIGAKIYHLVGKVSHAC